MRNYLLSFSMFGSTYLCRVHTLLMLLLTIIDCQDLRDFLGLNEPFFNHSSDVVFTAQEGGTAYLACEVFNLNNKSVSWVRGRDNHILTVDRETFISDSRFISMHRKNKMSDLVTLSIHGVTLQDQGTYECQVSAEHKLSKMLELVVLQPQVRILGDPDIHVNEGSTLKLKCVISNLVDTPLYVTWYLNNKMLVDFTGSFSSLTHSSSHSVSVLSLDSVTLEDSGNYSCQPAALPRANLTLHVLKTEKKQNIVEKTVASFNRRKEGGSFILVLAFVYARTV